MKGRALSKSWDDVFPDDHPLEFPVPKASEACMFDFDGQATPARHWRSSSAAEEDAPSSRHVLTPFQKLNEPTQDLIREIAILELEVSHLEQHLLALYRKTFENTLKLHSFHRDEQSVHHPSRFRDHQQQHQAFLKSTSQQISPDQQYYLSQNLAESQKDNPYDSQLSIGTRTRQSTCTSLKKELGLCSSYSQPILLPQDTQQCFHQVAKSELQDVSSIQSTEGTPCREIYSEYLIGSQSPLSGDPLSKSPNKLSEDLVCCMAAIYCKLAEPPLPHLGGLMSPSSSSSSASRFSAQRFSSDGWTSQCKTDSSSDMCSSGPSQGNCATECAGVSSSTVEVQWISVDNDRLTYAARMLRNFRFLVQQLEAVDPSQMKHEQKLAFWINIHNALMMHAYLAYGIPLNHLKRVSLLQKAAYKIGAHSINAQTIEQSILKCRSHRPAKWLQSFLSPAAKLRGDERQAYAIDRPEPLLCFALCCGGRSDPLVRVYTESAIHKELEVAKREFLQANVGIRRESGRVELPRMLESFARESGVECSQLLEWVCENVQEREVVSAIARCIAHSSNSKPHKCIHWLPYDFSFRYVFVSPLSVWLPTP